MAAMSSRGRSSHRLPVGAVVLNAVLPAHTGPTGFVPVESGNLVLSKEDGIEAKAAVIALLAAALDVLDPLVYTTTIIELLFEDYSPSQNRLTGAIESITLAGKMEWSDVLTIIKNNQEVRLEFKESPFLGAPKEIAIQQVSPANRYGRKMFVGIKDDGRIGGAKMDIDNIMGSHEQF
jgi:hypothetical protein